MNTGSHLTQSQIEELIARKMDRREILAALRHVEQCAECREKAAALAPPPAFALVPPEPTPHLDPEMIGAYVNRAMGVAEREIVDAHLEGCASCREDVANAHREPAPVRLWIAAAAAIIVAIALVQLLKPRHVPPEAPVSAARSAQPYAEPEWNVLVAEAVRSGTLPRRTDLADLRPAADVLRGEGRDSTAAVWPAGVVVDSTHPRLRWTEFPGATYVVLLQASDSSRIERGPRLQGNAWTPDFDLRRGTTYEWQVQVDDRGRSITIPAPPAPAALIHVLELSLHDELSRARLEHPDDHLLLAVLEGRAGLDADARSEVTQLAESSGRSALAARFLRSLPPPR